MVAAVGATSSGRNNEAEEWAQGLTLREVHAPGQGEPEDSLTTVKDRDRQPGGGQDQLPLQKQKVLQKCPAGLTSRLRHTHLSCVNRVGEEACRLNQSQAARRLALPCRLAKSGTGRATEKGRAEEEQQQTSGLCTPTPGQRGAAILVRKGVAQEGGRLTLSLAAMHLKRETSFL